MTGKIDSQKDLGPIKVTCPGCDKVYKIPRESVPAGKKVTVTCPKCKAKMEVRDDHIPPPTTTVSKDSNKEQRTVEYFDSDAKVALVACRDPLSLIQIEKE
ncbi:MAG TPA: hypothetical protein ENJ63_02015, partial [Dissulfuribacter thermophilus]|nr:hypothetical protein [Dissulfuribacter thermophilus]